MPSWSEYTHPDWADDPFWTDRARADRYDRGEDDLAREQDRVDVLRRDVGEGRPRKPQTREEAA